MKNESSAKLNKIYKNVLDQVLVFHEVGRVRARESKLYLTAPFSTELYQWEHKQFTRHFLGRYLKLSSAEISGIEKELAGVSRELSGLPQVLVHRDLQSSNVILKKGVPYFIDFQGMRFGSAVYDLASLLYDPYMELTEKSRTLLFDYYCANASLEAFDYKLFRLAAVQRLAQALGAYANLSSRRGTEWIAS